MTSLVSCGGGVHWTKNPVKGALDSASPIRSNETHAVAIRGSRSSARPDGKSLSAEREHSCSETVAAKRAVNQWEPDALNPSALVRFSRPAPPNTIARFGLVRLHRTILAWWKPCQALLSAWRNKTQAVLSGWLLGQYASTVLGKTSATRVQCRVQFPAALNNLTALKGCNKA